MEDDILHTIVRNGGGSSGGTDCHHDREDKENRFDRKHL